MKLLLASIAFCLSCSAFAATSTTDPDSAEFQEDAVQSEIRHSGQIEACQQLRSEKASSELLAQRGCCSHHGGVCGCSGGQQTCCDGTPSPSCTCVADQPPVRQN